MPTPVAYSMLAREYNLPARVTFEPVRWAIGRVLAHVRDRNPNHVHGRGGRRRDRYEHDLDGALLLLEATQLQGALVFVGVNGRGRAIVCTPDDPRSRSGRWRGSTIHPWALLHETTAARAPAIEALRARAELLIEWLRDNHPRIGWARPLSARRARALPYATRYLLPRRSWSALWAFRRAARALAALLSLLHGWWDRLIPAQRWAATQPKAAEQTSAARAAERQDRTMSRDQRPSRAGAWLRLVWPPPEARP